MRTFPTVLGEQPSVSFCPRCQRDSVLSGAPARSTPPRSWLQLRCEVLGTWRDSGTGGTQSCFRKEKKKEEGGKYAALGKAV